MSTATPETVEGITADPLISVLSPEFLKSHYLTGLDFVDKDKKPIPTEFFVQKITTAAAVFKRLTNVHVLQTVIVDERHDYHSSDYRNFSFIQLFEYPVVEVTSVHGIYPTGQSLMNFPTDWFRVDKAHGQLNLVPTSGSLASVLIGQSGAFLPLVFGASTLPHVFSIGYTTGFAAGAIPWDVIDAIAKLACIEIFTVMGLTVFPVGVSNISAGIDGLSQSMGFINNGQAPAAFSGWIATYRSDLYGNKQLGMNGMIRDLKEQYRGITLTSM